MYLLGGEFFLLGLLLFLGVVRGGDLPQPSLTLLVPVDLLSDRYIRIVRGDMR